MPLIVILIILLVLFGGGGYYMGPGIGYYGGGGISLILALIVIYPALWSGPRTALDDRSCLRCHRPSDNPLSMHLHQTAWNDRTHMKWQEHRSWKISWL
jgi:hypothetical protein